MSLKKIAVLAALAGGLSANVALAQTETAGDGVGVSFYSPTFATPGVVSWNVFDDARSQLPRLEVSEQPGGGGRAARRHFYRAFAGLLAGENSSGLLLGGGIGSRILDGDRHGVDGNVAFIRSGGANGLGIDVNYHYNLRPRAGQLLRWFLAGGLNIAHYGCDVPEELEGIIGDCGATDSAVQVGGGLERDLGGRDVSLELFLILRSYIQFMGRLAWLF
jgi:hypothetical protein